jgi:hypothetical protein
MFLSLGLKPTFREPEAFEGNLPVFLTVDHKDVDRRAVGRNIDVPFLSAPALDPKTPSWSTPPRGSQESFPRFQR